MPEVEVQSVEVGRSGQIPLCSGCGTSRAYTEGSDVRVRRSQE